MELIKKQVKKVIDYSQYIDSNVDILIEDWYKNKQEFIQYFGGVPIYNAGHVSIQVGEERQNTIIDNFAVELWEGYGLKDLSNFIEDNANSFFDNIVTNNTVNRKIPLGMKLLRAFKFFIEDENLLRKIQDRASFYLQQNKIEGELCLSVHPLDYLSMSVNNHKWRSCHSLDGEFRAGNLSYMCDSSTVVCYIKSSEPDDCLELFPMDVRWNSKKWRCLLHFSDNRDLMFMSKHYPFHLEGVLKPVQDMISTIPVLRNLFVSEDPFAINGHWSNYFIQSEDLWDDYIKIYGSIVPITSLITEAQPALQYNDVLRSNKYQYLYVYNPTSRAAFNKILPHIHIGHEIKCLVCGQDYITETESMVCDACFNNADDTCECDFCGRTILTEDVIELEGYYVCSRCYDESSYKCPRCGTVIIEDNRMYHEGTDEYYCPTCYEQITEN